MPARALATLEAMPTRLDDAALALVDAIARAQMPTLAPPTPSQFAEILRRLATLPRRADDDGTGELRAAIYARHLGDFPLPALAYLAREAIEQCRWMPTVAECLQILNGWKRNDDAKRARDLARHLAQRERIARFEDLCRLAPTMASEELEALPLAVLWRLENMMLVWRRDGRWQGRPQPADAGHG